MNNYSALSVPRGMIKFAQIIGTVFSVIGLAAMIFYLNDIRNGIGNGINQETAVLSVSLILAFTVYLTWKTIYTAVVIVKFVNKASDQEVLDNKYILATLSLTLGGFLTPFILTSFPNVPSNSSINPRWFLTRVLGMTTLVGGALFLLTFITTALTTNYNGATVSFNELTQNVYGIVGLVFGIATLVLGTIAVSLFFQNSSKEIFFGDTGMAKLMNVVAIAYLIIASIELVYLMFIAIIRLLGAIADLFRAFGQDGGFMKFMYITAALANLAITMMYVSIIIRIASQSLVGIWQKDGQVKITEFESINRAEQKRNYK
ncbi:hypothetical protein [[Acholeplasma] multilocale]|uniref:hypothetical protein n=1 Tax=[Acholeplasma] multilocale TaxID=264638 RepID=UPI00047A0597|nr:hypothetical protein [[Acholeplasma] multilocale]